LWSVTCAAVIEVVPQFQKMFADLGVEPPGMTMLLISLSYCLYHYWYVALLVVCLLNWGLASLLWSSPEGAVARRAWYVATWLVPAVLLGFVVVALLVPLLSLVSALSR
jgi:type II secretory pathway component PulF